MGFLSKLVPEFIRKDIYSDGFNAGIHSNVATDTYRSFSKLFENADSVKEFEQKIRDLKSSEDSDSIEALTAAYLKISSTRETIINAVEEVRKFYLVNVILDQLTQDALAPDINTNAILELTSPNPKIKKELDYLTDRFNFNRLVEDIVPDMCAYGDYTLAPIVTDHEGLTDIRDDVNQAKVIPLINRGETLGFIFIDSEDSKLRFSGPNKFCCFSLLSSRIRVDVASTGSLASSLSSDARYTSANSIGRSYSVNWNVANNEKVFNQEFVLPRYIRIGKSVIYPIIDKLKELELLEMLVPASKLSSLSKGSLLGMNVPVEAGINIGFDAAKRMETIINAKIGFSATNNMLTADQIINAAGRTKVIPLFGDKGTLSRMEDGRNNDQDLISSIDDTRRVICSSMGIPYELLFGGNGESRGDLLKRHSRYLRKVRGIQHSVSYAMKHLCEIHLKGKGIDFKEDEIEITFRNKIMDVSEIENLEFKDTSIGILQNFTQTIQAIAELPGLHGAIDNKALAVFVKSLFTTIGIPGVINLDKVSDEQMEGEGGEGNSFFGGGDAFDTDFGGEDMDLDTGDMGIDTGSEPDLGNGEPEITPAGNTETPATEQ